MLLSLLISISLGIASGIITGLIPGIHVNLISTLLVANLSLFRNLNPVILASFIISLALTHSFLDSIPSVFLGAPDSAMALGVLPGHRYLLQGKGAFAVKLTLIGSLFGAVFSFLLFPFLILTVKLIYPFLSRNIASILIGIVLYMFYKETKFLSGVSTFFLTGFLGLILLNNNFIPNPLFPLLSGLFGVSTLAYSIKDKFGKKENYPLQFKNYDSPIGIKRVASALSAGTVSGFLASLLPGLGSSQAAVIGMNLTGKIGDKGFLVLLGSINTINFVLSLVTFYVLNKARNGALVAVKTIFPSLNLWSVLLFLGIILFSSGISVFLGLFISKKASFILGKVDYVKLTLSVILFIFIMAFFLSGIKGILVLIVSTFLGLLPASSKCARSHAMGCLILPVIVWFLR